VLLADGSSSAIDADQMSETRTIAWTPTVVDADSGQSATIRRGDSLLLVTEEASGILKIDLDYDGIEFTPDLSGPAGTPIPAEFGAAACRDVVGARR